ncbi:MAG: Uma2 family endonuclease [Chloroflexi bacterium]|nr:Uma2 family endonuclease [Chloroflexota bacterium]MCY3607787.1 Uma2 family endonuclease [Acidimicrobiaceae bacterium]MCY3587154.1 Uma2 family endonuclease [Chloroflexota bacterium]MDE2708044.1 Uma2 family endonuclease [Chloroflexota bacterium]MXX31721.1 Uma2 family endonuclease [Chloroflexota bacterium]
MTTTEPRLLTAGDLFRLYSEGVRGELIRGVFCEIMSTGELHGKIVANLIGELWVFVKPQRLGTLLASDAGVWLERDPDTVREPDIAFISAERLALDAWNPGYSEVVPDLVIEVASPSDSRRELNDKARMWLSHGVRLVWVIHPDTRSVDVHEPDGFIVTLGEHESLNGHDILPDFGCAVSAIFDA